MKYDSMFINIKNINNFYTNTGLINYSADNPYNIDISTIYCMILKNN